MRTNLLLPTCLLCGILLAACSILDDPTSVPSDTCPYAPPNPIGVTPTDTSPAHLDVCILIEEDQDAIDHTSTITISFSTSLIEEPNYVRFDDAAEGLTCNQVQQQLGAYQFYVLRIPRGTYSCTYQGTADDSRSLAVLTTIFTMAPRSILSPQPPDVTSNGFSIRYTPDSDSWCTIVGTATDSAGDSPVRGKPLPSNQGIYNGPSIGTLQGHGEVALTRTCRWWPLQSSFDQVDLTYISRASVEVTWSH